MTTVLLVGTGAVAIRAARQLADTPGVTRLHVASRDAGRATELASAMGLRADVVVDDDAPRIPGDVDAVAVASAAAAGREWVRAAVSAGVPVATVHDAGIGELEAAARAAGVAVVTGCGLAPGLSDVLARHAADAFSVVEEVHVARIGAAGPACAEDVRDARRATPGEWRDGTWRADRAFGPELVWFPEPVGARECQLVTAGVAATVAAVPAARHVTMRFGAAPASGWIATRFRRDPIDAGWSAVRVEVTGRRDGMIDTLVYGVVDRTAVVVGAVLALAVLGLARVLTLGRAPAEGVRGLGEVVTPVPFLTELAARGVKAAAFEGVAPAA
jgi:hypothetical protein